MKLLETKDELFFQAVSSYTKRNKRESLHVMNSVENFPDICCRAHKIFAGWMYPQKVHRVRPESLPLHILWKNVEAVAIATVEDLRHEHANSFNVNALKKIYRDNFEFSDSHQLYKENYNKLKVSDVLEITGYTLKFSHVFLGEDTSKYDEGLLVLKSIDLALANKPHDKPNLKATHLAVDILSELAKKMTNDPTLHRCISGGTAIVQLAIRFFTH